MSPEEMKKNGISEMAVYMEPNHGDNIVYKVFNYDLFRRYAYLEKYKQYYESPYFEVQTKNFMSLSYGKREKLYSLCGMKDIGDELLKWFVITFRRNTKKIDIRNTKHKDVTKSAMNRKTGWILDSDHASNYVFDIILDLEY